MFPSRPLVKLDETTAAMNLSWVNIHSNDWLNVIRGTRILGLARQLECLAKYSIDMFKDLTTLMNETTKKYDNIVKKIDVVTGLLKNAKVDPKNLGKNESRTQPESKDTNQFSIKRTIMSEAMIQTALPPPDFSGFNKIENDYLKATGKATNNVDFNKYFSDPGFFKRQYVFELFEQYQKEKEEIKKEIRATRAKKKQESTKTYTKKSNVKRTKKPNAQVKYEPSHNVNKEDIKPSQPKVKQEEKPQPTKAQDEKKGKLKFIKIFHKKTQQQTHTPRHRQRTVRIPEPSQENTHDSETTSIAAPPPPPPPPPPEPLKSTPTTSSPPITTSKQTISHLDLIKAGNFGLKSVDKTEKRPAPIKKFDEVDPNTLSVQEILQQAAIIREAVACSDSSSENEESESSTTW
ncbi:WH2 motif family protein [Histomonas meleagridis]|uniref:WH2 motif family protein n=1 Tax=Histomonas meleagridis TaxID=135588 RepID=UPI00355A3382|nr:WH2 motif family protein [Histomonas meleagridis]KAH0801746.1 WH2 motif family protein [Histomonas meleagridis]